MTITSHPEGAVSKTLTTLPPELLHLIFSTLTLPARLSLKLASKHLYLSSPALSPSKSEIQDLEACARQALRSYISLGKKRKRCGICEELYPEEMLGNPWAELSDKKEPKKRLEAEQDWGKEKKYTDTILREGIGPLGGPGMVDIPDGVCGWHRGRFCKIVALPFIPPLSSTSTLHTTATATSIVQHQASMASHPYSPSSHNASTTSATLAETFANLRPGWYTIPSLLCFHCKTISHPERPLPSDPNTASPILLSIHQTREKMELLSTLCARLSLNTPCILCGGCETCAHKVVRAYIRVIHLIEERPEEVVGRFVVYRVSGEPWVREWRGYDRGGAFRDMRVQRLD